MNVLNRIFTPGPTQGFPRTLFRRFKECSKWRSPHPRNLLKNFWNNTLLLHILWQFQSRNETKLSSSVEYIQPLTYITL